MEQVNHMNKTELHALFEYYKDNLGENYIQIDVMFVQKTTSKKNIYKTWMLSCKNKDIIDMLYETLDNMDKIVNDRSIDKYDLEVSVDESIQVVKSNDVINFERLKEKLTVEYTPDNIISDKTDYNRFDFIYIQLSDNKDKDSYQTLTMIKRHLKSPAKLRGAKSFVFNGNEAKVYDKSLLIIGDNVEAFHVGETFYVLNRNNFNSYLNFKDLYYRIVDDNKDSIIESELFDDAEEFVAECRSNGRFVTRLTKAILADGFKNVKKNKSKLNDLKKDFKLNLEFTEDGKIIYKKEHIDEILNLLLEHYVTSALTDKKMLALAIEKYE